MNTLEEHISAYILNNLPALIFVKDTQNKLLHVNQPFAATLNLSKSQIENKTCWELFSKKLADAYWEDDKEILRTGLPKKNILEKFPMANNTTQWYKTDKHPLRNNNNEIIGVIGISTNIHQIKLEHDKLIQLETAIEYSPSIVVITDTNGIVTYINPRFTLVTGYKQEDILNKNINLLKSGKLTHSTYKQLWYTIKQGQVWHGEFFNKTKTGDYYWEIASIAPVKNQEQQIISFIKVSSALTDLKRTAFNVWNIFEESNNYIIILDKQMNIIYCNHVLARQLGFNSPNELIGKNWMQFIPITSAHIVKIIYSEILKRNDEVKESISDIQDIYGNQLTVKWFNSNINGSTGLVFSIGIRTKTDIDVLDSVSTIRKHFKTAIAKDKQFISALKRQINETN